MGSPGLGRVVNKVNNECLGSCAIAFSAAVALPMAAWYHHVTLLGILVNLVVIPYTALLMAAFLLALVCSPLGVVGQAVGAAAG